VYWWRKWVDFLRGSACAVVTRNSECSPDFGEARGTTPVFNTFDAAWITSILLETHNISEIVCIYCLSSYRLEYCNVAWILKCPLKEIMINFTRFGMLSSLQNAASFVTHGESFRGDPVIRRFPSGFTIELESYFFSCRVFPAQWILTCVTWFKCSSFYCTGTSRGSALLDVVPCASPHYFPFGNYDSHIQGITTHTDPLRISIHFLHQYTSPFAMLPSVLFYKEGLYISTVQNLDMAPRLPVRHIIT
jgi:hypothetical protein